MREERKRRWRAERERNTILSFFLSSAVQGSCIAAGYDTCCTDGFCVGLPEEANCYCDSICLIFDDCCPDFEEICPGMSDIVDPRSQVSI